MPYFGDGDPDVPVEEQRTPSRASCPECGGDPIDVSHNLSALGYRHDDQQLQCADCSETWTLGIPEGAADEEYWHDLICQSCSGTEPKTMLGRLRHRYHEWRGIDCDCGGIQFGRVHRVHSQGGKRVIGIYLKCPRCYYVWVVKRVVGDNNQSILGWPMTTGDMGDMTGWSIDGEIRPGELEGKFWLDEEESDTDESARTIADVTPSEVPVSDEKNVRESASVSVSLKG